MNFNEVRSKYKSNEICGCPGDVKLKYEAFSPILSDLYENKVVYRERIILVASLRDIKVTSQGFSATCIPEITLGPDYLRSYVLPRSSWRFAGSWEWMRLSGNAITALYSGWTIWPEKERIRTVIQLASKGDFEGALQFCAKEPEVPWPSQQTESH